MTDFRTLRRRMVDNQIRTQDVTDHRVLAAFLDVPREAFVRPEDVPFAYVDRELHVGEGGRALLPPATLARMVQALEVGPGDAVLDVACGTGYAAAVLSRLAARVVALESDEALASEAVVRLARLGFDNVRVVRGELASGHAAQAPYDCILLAGAVEFVPEPLCEQLAEGGRMALILRDEGLGHAMLYERSEGEVSGRRVFDAAATVLSEFRRPPAFVF